VCANSYGSVQREGAWSVAHAVVRSHTGRRTVLVPWKRRKAVVRLKGRLKVANGSMWRCRSSWSTSISASQHRVERSFAPAKRLSAPAKPRCRLSLPGVSTAYSTFRRLQPPELS